MSFLFDRVVCLKSKIRLLIYKMYFSCRTFFFFAIIYLFTFLKNTILDIKTKGRDVIIWLVKVLPRRSGKLSK